MRTRKKKWGRGRKRRKKNIQLLRTYAKCTPTCLFSFPQPLRSIFSLSEFQSPKALSLYSSTQKGKGGASPRKSFRKESFNEKGNSGEERPREALAGRKGEIIPSKDQRSFGRKKRRNNSIERPVTSSEEA